MTYAHYNRRFDKKRWVLYYNTALRQMINPIFFLFYTMTISHSNPFHSFLRADEIHAMKIFCSNDSAYFYLIDAFVSIPLLLIV